MNTVNLTSKPTIRCLTRGIKTKIVRWYLKSQDRNLSTNLEVIYLTKFLKASIRLSIGGCVLNILLKKSPLNGL